VQSGSEKTEEQGMREAMFRIAAIILVLMAGVGSMLAAWESCDHHHDAVAKLSISFSS
jgi:hypothetical protein